MATRIKTIEYSVGRLATLTDNTLTALSQITLYIPEFSGTVTFRSVIFTLSSGEGAGMGVGNYTTRRIDVSVGGAAATSYTSGATHTGSGEQIAEWFSADATSHFSTNWTTGTSKTLDVSVLLDATGTTPAIIDVGVTCFITYEYDDAQTTQIKTAVIPLNAPTGALGTAKPGTAVSVIPALDTYLPEASKSYRRMWIVCEGNINNTVNTTDVALSMQIDTLTAFGSGTYEQGATSDMYVRSVWDITSLGMTTNATHDFFVWASVAKYHHQAVTLFVTYEFNASASNDMHVSVRVPLIPASGIMGGTTSSDYQKLIAELWIEEPATITTQRLAAYIYYDRGGAVSGLNVRLGSGSFVAYTENGGTQCGGDNLMIRNDSAYTLARGKNTFHVDLYRTGTTFLGQCTTGYVLVNYTCGKPTQGYGAANRTVMKNLGATLDGTPVFQKTLAATGFDIPDTNAFLQGYAVDFRNISETTGTALGYLVDTERLSGEGGIAWEEFWCDIEYTDSETGLRRFVAGNNRVFSRWKLGSTFDTAQRRIDPTASRRWRMFNAQGSGLFLYLDLWVTMHNITFTVSGTVSGSSGGTVTLNLHRASDGELLSTTTRSGNGSYSFTWFDNTENLFVEAKESSTLLGRSDDSTAT